MNLEEQRVIVATVILEKVDNFNYIPKKLDTRNNQQLD